VVKNLERQYAIYNGTASVLGANWGVMGNPVGSISIAVTDTNFHCLTVVSPDHFNYPRQFTMRLTSTNNTSATYAVAESPGLSHVFQYFFKGNVTLWADGTGGNYAVVQSLFLDDAPVTYAAPTVVSPPPAPVFTSATLLGNGAFQCSFSGSQSASYTVLGTTNVALPLNSWTVLGGVKPVSPGMYQFTDPQATSSPCKFYRLVTP